MHAPKALVPLDLLLYLHEIEKFWNASSQAVGQDLVMARQRDFRRRILDIDVLQLMKQ